MGVCSSRSGNQLEAQPDDVRLEQRPTTAAAVELLKASTETKAAEAAPANKAAAETKAAAEQTLAADVKQALLLAGGVEKPHGDFHSSMQLMETGLFDQTGFERLHVAGHPEGNRDIDTDGSMTNVSAALKWKNDFQTRTDAKLAIATQFAFDAKPIINWVDVLASEGITLPVHIGIAGPAKLQTLIKFAIACGVGPSLKVLQKRAMDVTKLLLPYEPSEVITALAEHKAKNPEFNISNVHFFPLGGIKTNANWAIDNGGDAAKPANASS